MDWKVLYSFILTCTSVGFRCILPQKRNSKDTLTDNPDTQHAVFHLHKHINLNTAFANIFIYRRIREEPVIPCGFQCKQEIFSQDFTIFKNENVLLYMHLDVAHQITK